MQFKILRTEAIIYVFMILLLVNCKGRSDSENQITITIHAIDKNTQERRINVFDTVVVSKEGFGFLKKTFNKVGEYRTDSMGSVRIKIDSTKIFTVFVSGLNVYGSDMYFPGNLKNEQEVNIEVEDHR